MKWLASFMFLFSITVAFGQETFDRSSVEAFQKELNTDFSNPEKSPLMKEDRKEFKGLDFFPIEERWAVVATFVKSKNEKAFGMKTTTERVPLYIKYGELHFTIEGKELKLEVYQNLDLIKRKGFKEHLFLPFSDRTSGNESYIGGRYIDMKIPKGNTVLIDFNKAYNPYCAYNYKYSCPIVPLQNDLDVEIRAGVKKFHD